MNVAASFTANPRRPVSPYARRLAGERDIALDDLRGSGPRGRITAVDVLAYQAPVAHDLPVALAHERILQSFAFSAVVSLTAMFRLAVDAARVGLTLEIEDAALRAARMALAATDIADKPGIALEADGGQILISRRSDLSIGAERRLRLNAMNNGAEVSADPATASLMVLQTARVVPMSMPVQSGRVLRLVLFVDADREEASALLCANAEEVSEAQALDLLGAFVDALEEPLALMA